jgi:hypothetical protein
MLSPVASLCACYIFFFGIMLRNFVLCWLHFSNPPPTYEYFELRYWYQVPAKFIVAAARPAIQLLLLSHRPNSKPPGGRGANRQILAID